METPDEAAPASEEQHALAEEFRLAMASFASGVTIVSAYDEAGHARGATVSAFASVSLKPPLALVSITSGSGTLRAALAAGRFGVTVLNRAQEHLALHCAKSSPDRHREVDWIDDPHGVPLLGDGLARMACSVAHCVAVADHTILLGKVLAVANTSSHPLVYFRRGFHTIAAA